MTTVQEKLEDIRDRNRGDAAQPGKFQQIHADLAALAEIALLQVVGGTMALKPMDGPEPEASSREKLANLYKTQHPFDAPGGALD